MNCTCNKAFDFSIIDGQYEDDGSYTDVHEVHKCKIKPGLFEYNCQSSCGHYSKKYSKKWNKETKE